MRNSSFLPDGTSLRSVRYDFADAVRSHVLPTGILTAVSMATPTAKTSVRTDIFIEDRAANCRIALRVAGIDAYLRSHSYNEHVIPLQSAASQTFTTFTRFVFAYSTAPA